MDRARRVVLGLSGLGVALLGAGSFREPAPRWLYNPSQSAPVGWYHVERIRRVSRGDLVVSAIPVTAADLASQRGYLPAGVPVIKSVWAIGGDRICVQGAHVTVAGHAALTLLSGDRQGRSLQAWREGCTVLGQGDVFLVSDESPDSFDSRYFGPVEVQDIIGRAVFLGGGILSIGRHGGGTGRDGGDGKIKAHGAITGPVPCLHISFCGSARAFAEPGFGVFLNYFSKLSWLQWPVGADLAHEGRQ